jgi:hypothetical protein
MRTFFFTISLAVISSIIFLNLAFAGDVVISGAVELQYRHSSDVYGSYGNDDIKAEELYIQAKKEIAPNIEALIKLDGADISKAHDHDIDTSGITIAQLDETEKATSSHKMVEEAQVIFKKIGGAPITLVVGKDEMPFGQDYEKFYYSNNTHGYEIDKVWGLNGKYDIESFGSVEAAFFKRDTKSESNGSETALTDSFAARATCNKLINGLSFKISYAKKGKDNSDATEVDEKRISVGAKYSISNLTLHFENTRLTSKDYEEDNDPSVLLVGADYLFAEKILPKCFYETLDDDDAGDQAGSAASLLGVGINYYLDKKCILSFDYVTKSYEMNSEDSISEFVAAVVVKY